MPERKVRIGFVGVGSMGQGHCRTLGKVREAEAVLGCTLDHRALDLPEIQSHFHAGMARRPENY